MADNRIIITQWAFDSYLDLVGGHVIVSDPSDRNYNYRPLRNDALLLKKFRLTGESPKFKNDKFWERFKGVNRELFEMKWHNFGHARVQLRLHVYVQGKEIFFFRVMSKTTQRNRREK